MRHECRSPYVKTFHRSAVVWQLFSFWASQFFSTQTTSVPAATLTGWNRRIFLHLKLFNLSAPFLKIVKMYVGPYNSRKSNRKTGTSIKVWFFCKEVRWRFNRRPQRASWRVGASDPPSLLVSKLESSVKTGPLDDDSFGLNRFFINSSPHLQSQ